MLGIGAEWTSQRYLKNLKSNEQSQFNGANIKNQYIIYTTAILYEAIAKRSVLKKSDILWSEEDIKMDIGLQKFGVDLEDLQPATVFPKIILRCWIEDWEIPQQKKK